MWRKERKLPRSRNKSMIKGEGKRREWGIQINTIKKKKERGDKKRKAEKEKQKGVGGTKTDQTGKAKKRVYTMKDTYRKGRHER